jgi:hypothetical protein
VNYLDKVTVAAADKLSAVTKQNEQLAMAVAELQAENNELKDKVEQLELDSRIWPEWALKSLKLIRKQSGYDGYDDQSDGVDLPEELGEMIDEFNSIIKNLEDRYQRDVFGLNNEGDPIGGDPAGGYVNNLKLAHAQVADLESQLAIANEKLAGVGEAVIVIDSVPDMGHSGDCSVVDKFFPVGTKLYTTPQASAGVKVPEGYALVPNWHGYALLGTGNYLLHYAPPPIDPELGAEFAITLASDEDRSGNRQIGELRDSTRKEPYQPEEIAIRIGFLTPQALDALEEQLRMLRADYWPETVAPKVSTPLAQPADSEEGKS